MWIPGVSDILMLFIGFIVGKYWDLINEIVKNIKTDINKIQRGKK